MQVPNAHGEKTGLWCLLVYFVFSAEDGTKDLTRAKYSTTEQYCTYKLFLFFNVLVKHCKNIAI